jgi:hypothetical protein
VMQAALILTERIFADGPGRVHAFHSDVRCSDAPALLAF